MMLEQGLASGRLVTTAWIIFMAVAPNIAKSRLQKGEGNSE